MILEKPAAINAQAVRKLLKISIDNNVIFSVYQNRRLDGDFLTLKNIVESGKLGTPRSFVSHFDRYTTCPSSKKWKRDGGPGIGLIYDIGVHLIDQAYVLFGMPDEVYADAEKHTDFLNDPDSFEIILYYDGMKASLCAETVALAPLPRFWINGEKGSFYKCGRDVQEKQLLNGMRPPCDERGLDAPSEFGTLVIISDFGTEQEKIPTVSGNYGLYYDNFYRVMTGGEKNLLVPPSETIDVMRILSAAVKSTAEHNRVKIL